MLNAVFRSPVLIIGLFLVGSIFFGWQSRHFEINASADTLISDDNRLFLESRKIDQRFSPEEFLLVVYQPKQHPLFSEQSFNDIAELSLGLGQLSRVDQVRSILNVPLLSTMKDIRGDIDPEQYTQSSLDLSPEKLSEKFRGHPIYEGLIVDKEQSATAIQVLFKADKKLQALEKRINDLKLKKINESLNTQEAAELERLENQLDPLLANLREQRNREVEKIIELVKPYETRANIYLGGLQILGHELIDIIKSDLVLFGSVITAVICLVLIVLFRSVRWVIIPILCCLSSVVITLGLFGMLGLKATVISSSFIALQLILTLAIVIHLIVQYRETARADPELTQSELVLKSLKRKIAPCLYAGLTTSVGFGSLLLSGIQPVISFGWMMVVAMLVSIACSLLLLPALNLLFKKQQAPQSNSLFRWFIQRCENIARDKPVALYSLSIILALLTGAGLLLLDVENSFINYFDKDTRIYKELSYVDRHFGGSTPLDIIYRIPESQQSATQGAAPTLTAQTVQTLQKMQYALEEHKAVGTTLSVVNFTELAKQINDGKPLTEYELTALYWSLDNAIRQDLLGAFYAPDAKELRISTRIKDTTEGLNRKQLLADIHQDFAELGIERHDYKLSSLFVLYQDMLERLFSSQILTLSVVFAALFVMFSVIFRSLAIATIALIPNALSALLVLGSMGWLGVPLDFMTITIAAIAIGIAVDDTIHYIHRYQEEMHTGEPLTRSHHAVGYALLYTSLIVICGFSLLGFSDFTPSVMFGLFTSMAMAVAMITNLTLLPALLERYVKA